MKFKESYEKLKEIIKSTGIAGTWYEPVGHIEFKTDSHGNLKWGLKSGEISFEGPHEKTALFESALKEVMEGRNKLDGEHDIKNMQLESSVKGKGKKKSAGKIFIGHGRSPVWLRLKDFLGDRLDLDWDEFEREPPAGKSIPVRLEEMLDNSCFAFMVMTGEDKHEDEKLHARENVIHEIGLFQGRLGFNKAIVLLEEGCEDFSNIRGLVYIKFPKGKIKSKFEDIREVLEREGIIEKK